MKTFLKKVVLFVVVLLVVSSAGFLLSGGVARGETTPDIGIDYVTNDRVVQGQGFFIAPQVIATAWHVVQGATTIVMQDTDGRWFIVEPIGWNEKDDVALLGSPFVRGRSVFLNTHIFNGMPVYYKSIRNNIYSHGTLVPPPNWFRDRLLVNGDPVTFGDSGMPVFDAYNHTCVGMEVAVVGQNFGQILLVPAATLQSLAVRLGAWRYVPSAHSIQSQYDVVNPVVTIYAR